MNYGDVRLGDTVDLKFTTRRFSTGAPFTLAGSPAVVAYVGNGTTEITTGITLTLNFDGRTGLNHVRVVASAANGYATATNVALVISSGTVDGVSVVGEVVGMFSIEARPVVLPTVLNANVAQWAGVPVATPDTPGYPVATVKRGTGPGEILITDGSVDEVLTILGDVNGNLAGNVEGFVTQLTPSLLALIKAQLVAAIATDLYSESTAVPPASAPLAAKIQWITTIARNKILQTATQQRLRNDADTADIATVTVGDDNTTFTRGEWV